MGLELGCEAHRYRVEVKDRSGQKSLSISVDGVFVPLAEMAKVIAAMPRGFHLPEPPRDSRCNGPRALVALVVDARGGGQRRLVTFEISPARTVTVVRLEPA